ncbi:RapZ C-terminal domain-containing protein [Embleya hyalina]|uniref:Nucleotide-binding protein n=1 Tax=Embleya hyalina TaxID=516124 RepID=A0A401Z421_9ACTN|nr:RNase adapter RapZ [Embleya hyalina]GCE01586.1 nucleotide-binding protein [Embleya hyalina]
MTTHTGLVRVVISSIGTLHPGAIGEVGDGGLYFDVQRFRDPLHDPALRELTGLDAPVRAHVLATPGVTALVARIVGRVQALVNAEPDHRLVRVTIACRGGRHRSTAISERVAECLRVCGIGVEVDHRHIDRPVVTV